MSVAEIYLIWSNEHRAWWGPGRHGYTTNTDMAGRYSEVEATEIVLNANRYQKPDLPPNEIMVLAPAEPDLSDIPELDEQWFKQARLRYLEEGEWVLRWLRQLQQPVVVHMNMLRGIIAKPTWEQIKHLYPEEFAALNADLPTADDVRGILKP